MILRPQPTLAPAVGRRYGSIMVPTFIRLSIVHPKGEARVSLKWADLPDLGGYRPLPTFELMDGIERLTQALAATRRPGKAHAVAALRLVCDHGAIGVEVREGLGQAMRRFGEVCLTVLLHDDGIGVCVSDGPVGFNPAVAFGAPGSTIRGVIGSWEMAPPPLH